MDIFKEGYLSQKKKKKRYVIPFYIWPKIHLTDNFRYPTDSSKCIGLGSQVKSKMPKVPSLALGKRGKPVKVHELGPYLKNIYRKRYQCTQFSTCTIDHRVPGPELKVKPVRTMVQDSGKKREKSYIKKKKRKEKVIYQRERQIYILRN